MALDKTFWTKKKRWEPLIDLKFEIDTKACSYNPDYVSISPNKHKEHQLLLVCGICRKYTIDYMAGNMDFNFLARIIFNYLCFEMPNYFLKITQSLAPNPDGFSIYRRENVLEAGQSIILFNKSISQFPKTLIRLYNHNCKHDFSNETNSFFKMAGISDEKYYDRKSGYECSADYYNLQLLVLGIPKTLIEKEQLSYNYFSNYSYQLRQKIKENGILYVNNINRKDTTRTCVEFYEKILNIGNGGGTSSNTDMYDMDPYGMNIYNYTNKFKDIKIEIHGFHLMYQYTKNKGARRNKDHAYYRNSSYSAYFRVGAKKNDSKNENGNGYSANDLKCVNYNCPQYIARNVNGKLVDAMDDINILGQAFILDNKCQQKPFETVIEMRYDKSKNELSFWKNSKQLMTKDKSDITKNENKNFKLNDQFEYFPMITSIGCKCDSNGLMIGVTRL